MRTTWQPLSNETKLTFLLALTFLFLFSGSSVVFGDDLQKGFEAYSRKDYKEAIKWYQLSANQGYASAQYLLGMMYFIGEGVPKDYKEAVKWWELAANKGDASAQYFLGLIYAQGGNGVPQDYKEAVKWLKLAANKGDVSAQYLLGVMYAQGNGVPQDYILAHMWLNLSGANGYKRGIKLRNLAEKKMTASQIEKARELARNWKPTSK